MNLASSNLYTSCNFRKSNFLSTSCLTYGLKLLNLSFTSCLTYGLSYIKSLVNYRPNYAIPVVSSRDGHLSRLFFGDNLISIIAQNTFYLSITDIAFEIYCVIADKL